MSFYYEHKNFSIKDKQISLMKVNKPDNKRAYVSASATVEACLVIPLFLYAVMSVIYLMYIIGFQMKVEEALYNEGRKLSKYLYAYEKISQNGSEESSIEEAETSPRYKEILKKGISAGIVYSMFIDELEVDVIKKSNVAGQALGFYMGNSKIAEEDNLIELVVTYQVKNPFQIFGFKNLTVKQGIQCRAWLGAAEKKSGGKDPAKNQTEVYITETGTVYHTDKMCSYLALTVHAADFKSIGSKRNQNGAKYYSCEKCGYQQGKETVYITDYGNRYHTNINCGAIKRIVLTVPLSEVQHRRQCSKCKEKG